ncbi:MAG TPA: energy transducer TonB [Candidatus Acidoferrales bacterium]|nr:energy transducer TonB [Candidatus Acidoferrales bacterium]
MTASLFPLVALTIALAAFPGPSALADTTSAGTTQTCLDLYAARSWEKARSVCTEVAREQRSLLVVLGNGGVPINQPVPTTLVQLRKGYAQTAFVLAKIAEHDGNSKYAVTLLMDAEGLTAGTLKATYDRELEALGHPYITRVPASATTRPSPPACSVENREATLATAVSPDYPDSAMELNLPQTVYVQVEVHVYPTGQTSVSIYKSSGVPALDAAASRAALRSTYLPRIVHC